MLNYADYFYMNPDQNQLEAPEFLKLVISFQDPLRQDPNRLGNYGFSQVIILFYKFLILCF